MLELGSFSLDNLAYAQLMNCCGEAWLNGLLVLLFAAKNCVHVFMHLSSVCFTATFTQLELRDIQNELEDVTDWYQLGVQLGIKTANLDRIELNNPRNAQQCKTKVLDFWLQNAPECSWMKLAEAVEAMGEYAVLAEELRKKTSQGYCKNFCIHSISYDEMSKDINPCG